MVVLYIPRPCWPRIYCKCNNLIYVSHTPSLVTAPSLLVPLLVCHILRERICVLGFALALMWCVVGIYGCFRNRITSWEQDSHPLISTSQPFIPTTMQQLLEYPGLSAHIFNIPSHSPDVSIRNLRIHLNDGLPPELTKATTRRVVRN